ncbi:U32 family peptidase [uncultured Gemmiger sp.]|uniref:peptidase U32 family protein n=1 Tax=uncultured Gemmiger sp. TaxID=1623490 RepID=UPI0025DA53F3|nr:U32 family peptidase [uncultured Gemmiger sp.]
MLSQPELLSPAGSLETLKYAVLYGADAVYCALPQFGMRAAPPNLTNDELREGCIFAHARGRRVYLTLNTLPTNEELDRLPQAMKDAADAGVDAFIIADLGVLALAQKYAPGVEVHFSTQAGIANYAAATQAYKMGAKRVVLARELSLTDIAIIRDNTPPELELEAFVHGAMCMSVSGRCLLSSYMTGRSGNRGECAQPCRWKYYLMEERRPGQYMEIGENEDGSYILNANDLCTAPFIDLICKAGVDSLKIEGRAKTFYYVASVTSAYRRALDMYLADPRSDNFELPDAVIEELNRTSHRHYSPGFYFGKEKALQTPSHSYVRDWDFVGTVDNWENGEASCTQRSKFNLGDTLEVLQPDGSVVTLTPAWIKNEEGENVDATPHPLMHYTIPCEAPLMPYSLLRMQKAEQ